MGQEILILRISDSGENKPKDEIIFGRAASPGYVKVEDVADYFTRIGIDESLYKKIHDRYLAIDLDWFKMGVQKSSLKE